MQNKYVGDIGDFGKYGLLRALCGVTVGGTGDRLSLGIVWYFVKDKGVSYLDNPDGLRSCDRDLCDALSRIVKGQRRSVASIGESEIFPPDTVYFDQCVPGAVGDRPDWLDRALAATVGSDFVFLDPDNGLVVGENRASIAHVYFDEMARFVERGQSVIVIHHAGRQKDQTVDRQTKTLLHRIRTKIRGAGSTFALRYHRGAPVRVFFVIPVKRDQDILLSRAEQLTQGAWSGHFSLVDPESI